MNRLGRLVPQTLFGRTVITLVFTFGLFAVLTFAAVVYYALSPVSQRSADDLAAFMVLSAQTWALLPTDLRPQYAEKLHREYDLWLTPDRAPQDEPRGIYFLPYVLRVERALSERLGQDIKVKTDRIEGRRWFWIDLTLGIQAVRVGFPRDRIHTRPLTGLLVLAAISIGLALITAWLLARRITGPLTALAEAVDRVAQGESPEPLPEAGPRELASLARQFNRASRQVRELVADRTILLAGISHDLRTPLTRLGLALSLLPPETDAKLLGRMRNDLEEMNDLIAQALDLGKNLGAGERDRIDVAGLVDHLAAGRPQVIWETPAPCMCRVNPAALRRILTNLIDNALRYSDVPVEVHLDCGEPPEISVLDRGSGIPEDQKEAVFRPFYRLEQSRNRRTGGSGLGLAIARQLGIANQCEIRLRDRTGGGTVAFVRLPPPATS